MIKITYFLLFDLLSIIIILGSDEIDVWEHYKY